MTNFNVTIFKNEAPEASKFDAIVRIPNAGSDIGYITPIIRGANDKLADYQRVRAVKFFESITKIQTVIHASKHENIILQYGTMIGTYMLMRLVDATPMANIVFHGFNSPDWEHLKNFIDDRNKVTIYVFADTATGDVLGSLDDYCFIDSFVPKQMLRLGWESEALFNKQMPLNYKENLIVAFRFKTVVETLFKLGAKKIAVTNAEGLSDYSVECMLNSFEHVEVIGYDHPAVEEEKLEKLKEKFS